MKHTDSLGVVVDRINADLKTNDKQLRAAQEKVAKLQHREADLRQQLGRANDADPLKDDHCPQCYANSGVDQPLSAGDGDSGNKCPACNWTHVEIPQKPAAVPQQ